MEQWKEYKLGDICRKVCSGGTPSSKRSEYYDGDIPWLNTKEINFNRIYKTEKCITEEGLKNSSAKWIEANSVIVAMYGATAGKSAITKIPLTTNQACCNLTINSDVADYRYVYYFLCHKFYKLASLANGGAQQNLNAQIIKDFSINLPSLTEQMRIADVLSSLDDKIEVNRRINDNFIYQKLIEIISIWKITTLLNDNLEQQAQALFKSWFVDFEPFKEDEFVESELGMIPKGWRVMSLTNIANYTNGLAMQKFRPNNKDKGLPVLKIKELGQGSFDSSCDRCSSLIEEQFKVNNGDIIFSWSGTLLVDIWCGGICGLNQHLFKVTSKEFPKWFYYMWTKEHLRNFIHIANDKAVTMGHIKRGHLEEAKVLVPVSEEFYKMTRIIQPIIEVIIEKKIENLKLSIVRDTLLPRLMSGELKINIIDTISARNE